MDEYRAVDRRLFDLKFSPDGRYLAVCGFYEGAVLWNVADGFQAALKLRWISGLDPFSFGPLCTSFSHDGNQLAIGGLNDGRSPTWDRNSILVLDLATGDIVNRLNGHFGPLLDVEFLPGDRRLLSVAGDRTVRIWDVATNQQVCNYFMLKQPVARLGTCS